jgi:hypothetical protein
MTGSVGHGGASGARNPAVAVAAPADQGHKLRQDMRHVAVAMADAAYALADLSRFLLGTTALPPATVAVELRRAAWRLEHGSLEGWAADETSRNRPRYTLDEARAIIAAENAAP